MPASSPSADGDRTTALFERLLPRALGETPETLAAAFRALFELFPFPCVVNDGDGRYVLANQAFYADTGLTPAQVLGKTVAELGIDAASEESRQQLATEGSLTNVAASITLPDGATRHIRYYSRRLDGDTPLVLSVAVDVTDRVLAEQALQRSEAQLRDLISHSAGVLFQYYVRPDGEHGFSYISEQLETVFGLSRDLDDPLAHFTERILPDYRADFIATIETAMRTASPWNFEGWAELPSGAQVCFTAHSQPTRVGDELIYNGVLLDVTPQRRAEEERVLAHQRTVALLQLNQMTDASLREITDFALEEAVRLTRSSIGYLAFLDDDEQVLTMHSWSRAAMAECAIEDKPLVYPVATTGLWGEAVRQRRTIITNDYAAPTSGKRGLPAGHVAVKRHLNVPIFVGGKIVALAGVGNKVDDYDEDDVQQITLLMEGMWRLIERKRAHEALHENELRLQQAQKMESVGRLAGGVAHDFNNMLGVILGYAELALMKAEATPALRADLEQIRRAAERSAELTRQLLAFARKQTVAPRLLDLNDTIAGMLKMLRRLIGEDIALIWQPGAQLGLVHIDPAQVDQILANLCVNARDALHGGGQVIIETQPVTFDAQDCAEHPEARPGPYVLLAVSDTGCGIAPDALDHLFEPFFTTKELGAGTGLGLATVYGIVRQNDGLIQVYSEPGQGTTFKIYLPRHDGAATMRADDALPAACPRGVETVLLVEDEPAILNLGRRLLQPLGYQVLAAATPREALELADTYPGALHLLITDVVMPEMNGRELARRLVARHPGLKCLFMSGYTANVIAHHGVLDPGVHFVEKPFTITTLATKVREALDG